MQLNSADLVVPRMEAWRLLWDFRCVSPPRLVLPDQMASDRVEHSAIKDLARALPERSPLGNKCLEVDNGALHLPPSLPPPLLPLSRSADLVAHDDSNHEHL